MKMKYIIVKDGNLEVPHIFSEYSTHRDVANAITRQHLDEVVSAGFCDYSDDPRNGDRSWACFSESTSLNIKSRAIDAQIMNQMFNVNN